jgi:N-acetylmuramoyl-L-alanine amidase
MRFRPLRALQAASPLVVLAAACARGPLVAVAPSAAVSPAETGLPPVPRTTGALEIRVVSPGAQQSVGGRDSTFVFGSVGSGDATLTINGAAVPVAPNGAFLAFLPVPPAAAPRYELVATRGAESARRTVAVRVPTRRVLPAAGRLVVDSGSVAPAGRAQLRPDEAVRVSVRAPRNATVWLATGGDARVPLVDAVAARGAALAAAGDDAGTTWVTELPARSLAATPEARLVIARGVDTVRLRIGRVTTAAGATTDGPRDWVSLGRPTAQPDTDRVIVGRPVPEGTYRWFFAPGTPVERTGAQGAWTRVRLDQQLEVWVDSSDAVGLPTGWSPPRRVAGGARVTPAAGWVDLLIPLAERPPYQVIERGREIDLVLYGTTLSPDILPIWGTATDSLVRQVAWDQEATDRVRVTLRLDRPVYGYLVLWDAARGGLVLRVRRPPTIDRARPLRGLTIVVDAGHPPGGATGPTRPDRALGARGRAAGRRARARPVAGARRGGGDDAHVRGAGRTGRSRRDGAPCRRPRVRLDPPQRVPRWRESVRQRGHEHALLPSALGAARAARAARDGAALPHARHRHPLPEPRGRATALDARDPHRRTVPDDPGAGGRASLPGRAGAVRACGGGRSGGVLPDDGAGWRAVSARGAQG